MEALMFALMVWSATFLGLPAPDKLPNVVISDRCEIQAFVTGVYDTTCKEDGEGVLAAYNHINETMFLPKGFDPRRLRDQAILLHELAHHVQWRSGQIDFEHPEPCHAAAIEKPAYDATFAYLAAAGVEDPYATIGANGLFIALVTMCREPFYMDR